MAADEATASDAPTVATVKAPEVTAAASGGRRSRHQEQGTEPHQTLDESMLKLEPVLFAEGPTEEERAAAQDRANEVQVLIEEAHSTDKRENQRAVELMWSLTSAGPCEYSPAPSHWPLSTPLLL